MDERFSTVSVMDFSTSLPLDGKLRVNLSVLFFPRTVYTNGSNSIVSPFHFLCGRGTRRSRRSPSSAQAARRDCIRRWLLPRLDRSQLRCRSECKRPQYQARPVCSRSPWLPFAALSLRARYQFRQSSNAPPRHRGRQFLGFANCSACTPPWPCPLHIS